jgi:hypothetical protein
MSSDALSYDIFVASKGRPDGSTFAFLEQARIPYTVVVEKADVEHYKAALPRARMWVLPRSGMGIGYCRSYILKNAGRTFVMMDDDISKLYRRKKTGGCLV